MLDPSCGSGTFLFHAVRRYLAAAGEAGRSNAEALEGVTAHVAGIDLHPVAVTLARVTYLLAIGPDRLQAADRPPLQIPVYLGDSIQWGQRQDLFSSESLCVDTDDGAQMFADQLKFPQSLLDDADRFDQLVGEMANAASGRGQGTTLPSFSPIARRHALGGAELVTLQATFETMCRLHDEGRDHIWGYYVRNLARPAWFARPQNRVDVVIGNPPWLSYRFMTKLMKEKYRQLASDRGLWAGGSVATQQDLSDVFVVRTIERYLAPHGRFAFVMPAAVLTRGQFDGFRRGSWATGETTTTVSFDTPWDLSMVYPYFFPRTSAVVSGTRISVDVGAAMGSTVIAWTGSIPDVNASWSEVEAALVQQPHDVAAWDGEGATSPYASMFTNGATVFPRVLTTVITDHASPVGVGAGRTPVRSNRGTYEKQPWKAIPDLDGVIEQQFLFPLLLGECVMPFREIDGPMAVLPLATSGRLVDPNEYPGLAEWWGQASALWEQHRSSAMSLTENVDYRHKLTNQFPTPPHRVVLAHSAMHVAACRIAIPNAVVEHQLDWASVGSPEEGQYLCAVLNSPEMTVLAEPHMTSGKGGGRHIGKSLWKVPVPRYDAADSLHVELSQAGSMAEDLVAEIELPRTVHGTQRRLIRKELAQSDVGKTIDRLVARLLQT